MARTKTSKQQHRGFNTRAVANTSTPTTCPVCGETPAVAKGEKRHQVLEAHIMAQHRPDVACRREHRNDGAPDWRLDWDAVVQGQPWIFYCSECGYYHHPE